MAAFSFGFAAFAILAMAAAHRPRAYSGLAATLPTSAPAEAPNVCCVQQMWEGFTTENETIGKAYVCRCEPSCRPGISQSHWCKTTNIFKAKEESECAKRTETKITSQFLDRLAELREVSIEGRKCEINADAILDAETWLKFCTC
mmetsp:Transcript_108267/g.305177  ORF Transcript_108267/g.305177 Transcript_108267/m.305177 type:complete len:145 (-) Transcript_108267:75-509(-)